MIPFDPLDPYPLLPEDARVYADEQAHAERVDDWLGVRAAEIERELPARYRPTPGEERWINLPLQTLQTPYTELRFTLTCLAPRAGQRIIDLGAGYGRMGLVLARHFPQVEFLGHEIVPERVAEGRRVLEAQRCALARLEESDLGAANFRLGAADFYFLYDFGAREAIRKTLGELRELAARRAIVVVGRGRASRDLIEREHPWLSAVVAPEQRGRFTIYRST